MHCYGRTGYLLDGAGRMGSHASSSGSCQTTPLGTSLLLRKDWSTIAAPLDIEAPLLLLLSRAERWRVESGFFLGAPPWRLDWGPARIWLKGFRCCPSRLFCTMVLLLFRAERCRVESGFFLRAPPWRLDWGPARIWLKGFRCCPSRLFCTMVLLLFRAERCRVESGFFLRAPPWRLDWGPAEFPCTASVSKAKPTQAGGCKDGIGTYRWPEGLRIASVQVFIGPCHY